MRAPRKYCRTFKFLHGHQVGACAILALFAAISLGGCKNPNTAPPITAGDVQLSSWRPDQPEAAGGAPLPAPPTAIQLAAAGNEWSSFIIELSGAGIQQAIGRLSLSLSPLVDSAGHGIDPSGLAAYQLVDLPVDVNRATSVRHAGQMPASTHLPRALLPLTAEGSRFSLASIRPPLPPQAAGGSARVWFDLRVPSKSAAGVYTASCDLLAGNGDAKTPAWQRVTSIPIRLVVHNFSLPDHRNLSIVGEVPWKSLVAHFSEDFEAVTPRLLNRKDAKYSGTVATLDGLMKLAANNRVSIVYPGLQPYVSWPPLVNGAPVGPKVHWEDFDALIGPWLNGTAFGDQIGVGCWPLPEPDSLHSYDPQSRLSYWSLAASHFDGLGWLGNSAIWLRNDRPGRVRGDDAIALSIEAGQLLWAHPAIQVNTPLEEGQVQLAESGRQKIGNSRLIDPETTKRLRVATPGLIGARPQWPSGVEEPKRWVRAEQSSAVSTNGPGGGEQDIRLWAWLAYLRRADQVLFGEALPAERKATDAADPSELVWFYPGEWFGLNHPVESVQIKWLRDAEQDYEYLHLARLKEESVNSLWIARLITKPVEIGLGQSPDDAYALMTGTADPKVWSDARELLARLIELYADHPDGKADRIAKEAAEIDILHWARPQERPLLIGRTTRWSWAPPRNGTQWVNLSLGLDVYNAADVAPGNNQLRWTSTPLGWERQPQPVPVPVLTPYRVLRTDITADFNLGKTAPGAREPSELELTVDSPTARLVSPMKLSLPVAPCERRVEGRFRLDGKLDDWSDIDLIQSGPLVKMLSRPVVLAQQMELASTKSRLYANFALDDFYVGFALQGVSKPDPSGAGSKNFVDYQARRAWGEDLCEVLVQPIYADNSLGPILHVVCKPNGSNWVERKLDPLLNADPWEPFESTGTRYAAFVSGDQWTGELAIPWKVLMGPKNEMPTLLRFNFSQHQAATGESASWAGPVDFGRDDALTGLLHLKLPVEGNPGDAVQNGPGNHTP